MNPLFIRRLLATAVFFNLLILDLLAADHRIKNQAELNAAIAHAMPGDNLVLVDGTYEDLVAEFSCQGAEGNLITLRAETPGGVTLTGESHIIISGSYLVVHGLKFDRIQEFSGNAESRVKHVVRFVGATHCRLTQCYFFRCGWFKWAHIVQLHDGSNDNRVDHNTWERIRGQGVGVTHAEAEVAPSVRNQIDHNYFNRTEPLDPLHPAVNGNEPIQLGQGSYADQTMAAVVEFNLIENMHTREGADPELISVKTADNRIRFNTFRGNDRSQAITLRYATRCVVEGNFLLGSGIRVYGSHHVIMNNYIAGAERGIYLPGADGVNYPATNEVLVANNTIIDPHTAGISLRATPASPLGKVTLKNNLVKGGVVGSNLYYRDPDFTAVVAEANLGYNSGSAVVTPQAPNDLPVAVTANPNLLNIDGVERLPSGASAAKAAGVAVDQVTHDIDGKPRVSPLDIGAERYLTDSVARIPLVPADVGPAWLGGPADSAASPKPAMD